MADAQRATSGSPVSRERKLDGRVLPEPGSIGHRGGRGVRCQAPFICLCGRDGLSAPVIRGSGRQAATGTPARSVDAFRQSLAFDKPQVEIAISVIIPAFNEAKRLPPYLELVRRHLDQRYPGGYEVVVVDDGSRDETLEAGMVLSVADGDHRDVVAVTAEGPEVLSVRPA